MDSPPVQANAAPRSIVAAARRRAWACVAATAAASILAIQFPGLRLTHWTIAGAAAVVLTLAAPAGRRGPAMLLLVFALSGAWFTLRTTTWPANSIALEVPAGERGIVEVIGVVTSDPELPPPPQDVLGRFRRSRASTSFDFRVEWLVLDAGTTAPSSGRVRVTVDTNGEAIPVVRGDRVRIMGWLIPPSGPANPGERDRLRWARMANDAGLLSVGSPDLLVPIPPRADPGSWLATRIHRLRAGSIALIDGDGTHDAGRAMLAALLLGEREHTLDATSEAFARSGTAHLLAISGFHLAILTMLGLYLVRLTGDHGRLEPLLVALLVVLILALVPARVPIVRAGAMVLCLLASDALGRRYDRLTLLAWIAVGLFVWRPMDVFSLGAQLSVGVTALLLWVAHRRHPWISPMRIMGLRRSRVGAARRVWLWARASFSVCVLCWLVSLPVVAMHTGIVSIAGAATTFLVTPPIVLLLAGGYLALAVGVVAPAAGGAALDALAVLAEAVGRVVGEVAQTPGLVFDITPPPASWTVAAVLAVLVYVARARVLSPGPLAAAVVLMGWLALDQTRPRSLPQGVALRVDVLSVSDGTCFIVRSGDDALLWDCGSLHRDLSGVLERARDALRLPRMSLGFVTHANLDHYNAMPDAADILGLDRVFASPHVLTAETAPLAAFRAELASRSIPLDPVSVGAAFELGDASISIIWPAEAAEGLEFNDRSLVAVVSVPTAAGERRVLLVGDIEQAGMEALLAGPAPIGAHVLEAPHHGSFKSAAQRFVAAVAPAVVLQSTGHSRAGDARWDGQRARSRWLCTATDGAIAIEIMYDGTIRARTMR